MVKQSRATRQKEAVLNAILSMNSFFTTEELFEKAIKKDSKMGIATVYRFLKELKEQKKLHYYTCERKTLYSLEGKSHCHFICEKCGKTEHLNLKNVDFFKKEIKGDVCHFQLDVFGTCKECLKK